MSKNAILFEPFRVGDLVLPNRILMAPLTRNRAEADGTLRPMTETYYAQRASAGLIISEATQISPMGKGYIDTPGLHDDAQMTAWRGVTDAVHAAGGRIFCQLWHVGRISHTSLLPDNRAPLSSSAVRAQTKTFTRQGFEDCSEPRAMTAEQIQSTLDDYARSARYAKQAGFDGVEVHSANGYLIDQFLQDGVNKRDDEYGGAIENRMRFLVEVLDRVGEVFSPDRIGIRLSPLGQANDISDSDPEALFTETYRMLSGRKLAYLHVVEEFYGVETSEADRDLLQRLRGIYDGVYIGNGGYTGDLAGEAVQERRADAISFGRPFIANPDLPERIRQNGPFNDPDQDTFYGGGAEGYIDYPFLRHW